MKEIWEKKNGNLKRDDWMLLPDSDKIYRTKERDKSKREIEREERDRKVQETIKQRQVKIQPNVAKHVFGDQGSSWRMMKLKRIFEIAREESRNVEEVAIERMGSLEAFNEAIKERDYLDEQKGFKRPSAEIYRPRSSSSFRKPIDSMPKPAPAPSNLIKPAKPSVIDGGKVLSSDELNQLHASVLKARIMKAPNLSELESKYELEMERAEIAETLPNIQNNNQKETTLSKSRLARLSETHDKFGNRIKYLDEDDKTLDELVRQEKLGVDDQDNARKKHKTHDTRKMMKFMEEERALSECPFCYHDGYPPKVPVISVGIKTYLGLPQTIEMVIYID